jgi:hypothetical protein
VNPLAMFFMGGGKHWLGMSRAHWQQLRIGGWEIHSRSSTIRPHDLSPQEENMDKNDTKAEEQRARRMFSVAKMMYIEK